MKFRRITAMVLLLCLLMLGSCSAVTEPADDTTSAADVDETTPAETSDETTTADVDTTPEETTAPDDEPVIPKSIKILAIGNSFSTDCMQYLWDMLHAAGIEEVTLGNLYYGGCLLSQHLGFATNDSPSYTYYKNTRGSWGSTANYKFSTALADEDWDIITMQESSKTSGVTAAYKASLTRLVAEVRKHNTTAKLYWNMTWAYQSDSTHSSFPTYGKDQMKMYGMIIDCVKEHIVTNNDFSEIIPVGTVIQNARTSYLGDHLTRDGYHLDKGVGRYMAALTWFSVLTGLSPDTVKVNPAGTAVNADMISVSKEAVKNAIAKPFEVTESQIKTGEGAKADVTTIDPSEILNPEDFIETDKELALGRDINLDNYTLLKWEYLENTYWNCTSKAGTTVPGTSAGTYHQNICSKEKYSVEQLPCGTVFICDPGWQYRIELYSNTTDKYTGTRPAMQADPIFVMSEEFLNGAKYYAWNIATTPKSDISAIYAQAAAHLRIYVPNTAK